MTMLVIQTHVVVVVYMTKIQYNHTHTLLSYKPLHDLAYCISYAPVVKTYMHIHHQHASVSVA